MSSRITCLKRIGENVKKHKLIILDGKEEVTIGRNPDVTVCILSTMISRCHAILKKTAAGAWTIRDNKSLNGIYVNDKKLEPQKPYELNDGETVQFGVATSAGLPPEFSYRYFTALKVKQTRKADELDGHVAQKSGPSGQNQALPTSCSQVTSSQPDVDCASPSKRPRLGPPDTSPFLQYRKKLQEQEAEATTKMADLQSQLLEMQKRLQEKESAESKMAEKLAEEKCKREDQSKVVENLKMKEEQLKQEFEAKQAVLVQEQEEMATRMRDELEDQLQVKEANLMENLESQRQALLREKVDVEDKLKRDMESVLAKELLQQKEKLEKVIEKKEAEQKLLECQLKTTEQEKDRKQEEVLRAREDILSNFAELMETELQCSICNELFIKATSLNCSHGFCSLCINQWMKVKKECPVCRSAITTHMRSIVLDSYIEKMVEQFSDDLKAKRQELVDSRKQEEAAFEAANRPPPPAPPGPRVRGRGRGRGGRVRGGRGNMAAPPPRVEAPPLPILIPDDDDDDSDEEDSLQTLTDSDSERSGDEDAYFGGYGACYNCGRRGHWANGCPFS